MEGRRKSLYALPLPKREGIMSVYELNKNQLIELKQNYLCEVQENVSYGELCDADNIISDEEIFQAYSCMDFSSEDFMCA